LMNPMGSAPGFEGYPSSGMNGKRSPAPASIRFN
jgi:hypothetical protein